ncbi:MAG: DNA-processing protein DprA [Christensenellaceae bacterium]
MNRLSNEEKYWLWLTTVPGIGPNKFYAILSHYVDIKTAFENVDTLAKEIRGIGPKLAQEAAKCACEPYIDEVAQKIEKSGVSVLTRLSQDYPKALAEIDNPPPVLYFRGSIPDLDETSCGIVGTRKPTRAGAALIRKMAGELAGAGVPVVSGMARGIDTAAHMGALDGGGKTVAVLGCGADVIYPPENGKLYDAIIQNGAVISEYFPGTGPAAGQFPQRNRIISGLSRVLIAGEGDDKSGARITVDYSLTYGRDVYTVICDLRSSVARLPLYLIENGAPVLEDAYALMEDQGWTFSKAPEKKHPAEHKGLDFLEAEIYNLLEKEKLSPEEMARMLKRPIREVVTALTKLEMKGLVQNGPGDVYCVHS